MVWGKINFMHMFHLCQNYSISQDMFGVQSLHYRYDAKIAEWRHFLPLRKLIIGFEFFQIM